MSKSLFSLAVNRFLSDVMLTFLDPFFIEHAPSNQSLEIITQFTPNIATNKSMLG